MSAIAALAAKECKPGRFPGILQARCPNTLPPIIERVAQSLCMTPSEYIRRSVIERLRADGIDLRQMASQGAGSL